MERLAEEIRRRAGEAGPRLAALRRHVEGEAAKGNAEASLLLREWK